MEALNVNVNPDTRAMAKHVSTSTNVPSELTIVRLTRNARICRANLPAFAEKDCAETGKRAPILTSANLVCTTVPKLAAIALTVTNPTTANVRRDIAEMDVNVLTSMNAKRASTTAPFWPNVSTRPAVTNVNVARDTSATDSTASTLTNARSELTAVHLTPTVTICPEVTAANASPDSLETDTNALTRMNVDLAQQNVTRWRNVSTHLDHMTVCAKTAL